MLPDRVSNPGPLTYESGALPIAARLTEVVTTVPRLPHAGSTKTGNTDNISFGETNQLH